MILSPLYRFLAEVFAMPNLSSICVYFGDEGDHMIPQLPHMTSRDETTHDFLSRFTTPNRLNYGIFRLKPG